MKSNVWKFVTLPAALCALTPVLRATNANEFTATNLVSDNTATIPAAHQVNNLVNPWGLAFSATSPIWVANNGSGTSDLFNGAGVQNTGIVATIQPAPGSPAGTKGTPTGMVFNAFTAAAAPTFNRDNFIFATEDGTIQGWRGGIAGNVAEILVNNAPSGAVYKGLAISNTSAATNTLYAADFHNGVVLAHPNSGPDFTFTDSSVPVDFAPFNVQDIGGKLFVTYAKQDADKHDDVSGAGNGYIDVFNLDGSLDTAVNGTGRLVSGGVLNSPWGLAVAPATGFGPFGGDLLVGNFGDGTINVFNLNTGAYIDTLKDDNDKVLKVDGLWGIAFGNGAGGAAKTSLYYAAGAHDEADGALGEIHNTPDTGTGTVGLAALFLGAIAWLRPRARKQAA